MHFTRLLETFSVYLAGGKWERRQKRKELGFMFHDDSCWVPAARLVVGGRGGETFRHCRCHLWKRKSYRDSKARFSDGRTPAFKLQSSTSLQKKLFLCFDEKKGWRKKTSLRNNQWEKRSDRTREVQPVLSASFSFFLVPREFQHPQSQFEIMRSWRRLQRHWQQQQRHRCCRLRNKEEGRTRPFKLGRMHSRWKVLDHSCLEFEEKSTKGQNLLLCRPGSD